MRTLIVGLARGTAAGALACLAVACGGPTPAADAPPPVDPAPTEDELRRLQQRISVPIFWLGESYLGAALSDAERTSGPDPAVSLSYGPLTCAGDSGCTYELEVDTTALRRPHSPEQSCWHRVGRAWLDWCEGYESGELYVGSSRVSIFSVNATPDEVSAEIRPFPRRDDATLPPARRFSCREARELPRRFVRSLPRPLRSRGC
jgi:hypothetical protein